MDLVVVVVGPGARPASKLAFPLQARRARVGHNACKHQWQPLSHAILLYLEPGRHARQRESLTFNFVRFGLKLNLNSGESGHEC